MFNEESYRAALVAAIQAQGAHANIAELIEETVDALIAADRKLSAYDNEVWSATSEARKPN